MQVLSTPIQSAANPALFQKVIPASQADPSTILPILKAQEDQVKGQIPSMFSDMVSSIGSPTKLLKDYAITGDQKLKSAAGNALAALSNVAHKSKSMFTLPQIPGELSYTRQEQVEQASTTQPQVPKQYQAPVATYSTKYTVPSDVLGQIVTKESSGNPMAIHRNKDGTIDKGLMQINSVNMKAVNQYFASTGRHFDAFNATDSIEAAAYILKQNQTELTQALGRKPTDQELYDSYNLGVQGFLKSLQGNTEEKNLLQKYNMGSIFASS